MYWEKKICIRVTLRRIMGAILAASVMANLAIVGAVYGAISSAPTPTATPETQTQSQAVIRVTPSATITDIFTFTPVPSPTATASPATTPTDLPTLTLCILRSEWPAYYAQWGETLSYLAGSIGSSTEELMQANCLSAETISPGQLLYLPRLPVRTPTPSKTATDVPSLTPSDTSTATVNPISDVPTSFQNPSGTYAWCAGQPAYFSVSVTPDDPQGISFLTASYSINGDGWSELRMQPDGTTYYGSISLQTQYETVDSVAFTFLAYDGSRNRTESAEYNAVITSCSILQQSN